VAAQVGRLEGLECEVDQLQNVLQSVASELESGHQQAQVRFLCTKQQAHQYSFFVFISCIDDYKVAMVHTEAIPWEPPGPGLAAADCTHRKSAVLCNRVQLCQSRKLFCCHRLALDLPVICH